MELPQCIIEIRPTLRPDGKFLVITTTLPLPGTEDFDAVEFAELSEWAEAYRIRRYPDLALDFRTR